MLYKLYQRSNLFLFEISQNFSFFPKIFLNNFIFVFDFKHFGAVFTTTNQASNILKIKKN